MTTELLDLHKNNILNYLFDKNKTIKNFEENKDIILTNKWDFLLDYPNELYTLRRTKTNKSVILSIIITSLLEKKDRVIHPILLIIFHNELVDYIGYYEMDDETFDIQLLPKNKKILKEIKPQINVTFKIYWKLINDIKIKQFLNFYDENELVKELINSLYYKISVEQLIRLNQTYIETKKVRFNDLCLNLDIDDKLFEKIAPLKYINFIKQKEKLNESQCNYQNKILVEINESHHEPLVDFLRKTTIYQTTGKVIIDYDIIFDKINDIYIKIMKEVAKTIYKNYDEYLGIIFYLLNIENIDIKMAQFFLDIRKSKNGVSIKQILNVFRGCEFTNKKNFMKIVKKELNSNLYFVTKDENNFKDSLLSQIGVDRLIFLPRSDDFIKSEEIFNFVEIYTKFRQGFFNTIETFLSNCEENNIIVYLVNKLSLREDFQNFKEPLITAFVEKALNPVIIQAIQDNFNVKLDKYLPILIKSDNKYHNIELNIMKNTFGNKVADIIERRFNFYQSKIENRTFISKEIIDFIFNF